MTNQAAQTMPFQPEIFRAIARSTSDTAKTNALLNAAREIERLTAALSQTAGVVVSDEMIERACKDYALRVDGALWPDAYDEHEVLALRAQLREFLLNAIGTAPAASGVDTSTNEAWAARAQEKIAAMDAASGGEAKPAFGKELPSSDEEAMYAAAGKGFHTSETSGTDGRYVHVIRFRSIEELHAYEHAWTAAMVKVRDSRD